MTTPSTTMILFPLPTPSGFAGNGAVFPLVPPPQEYAVDGVLLADQPVVATAPALLGRCIPRGSTLSLSFANPGTATQSALATGSQVALTFVLSAGEHVTGRVQLASTLVTTVDKTALSYVPRIFTGTLVLASAQGTTTTLLLVNATLLSDLFLSSY